MGLASGNSEQQKHAITCKKSKRKDLKIQQDHSGSNQGTKIMVVILRERI